MPQADPGRLRVLRLRTPEGPQALPLEVERFVARDALSAEAASEGGVGLATALHLEGGGETAPVALAVGSALVRGLPTAARLSLVTRGVLREGLIDGQVGGGDLARRLASICDGLLLSGGIAGAGTEPLCLHLSSASAEFHRLPELDEASPREALRILGERFGEGSALVLGPSRTEDFAFSGLTAGELGRSEEAPTSFLGRGGVGARFAALGLRALVITAPVLTVPLRTSEHRAAPDHDPFAKLLRASPRLAERAAGGTLELLDLHARAAEIDAPGEFAASEWAEKMAAGAREAQTGRHGCKGCPTPCGLVFDRSDRKTKEGPQGARFGALHAVTARLGLDRFGDGLELLRRCDELGLDAKEAGLALYVLQCAAERGAIDHPSPRGDAQAHLDLLESITEPSDENSIGSADDFSAEFKLGADALAERFGLQSEIAAARADLLGGNASASSSLVRGSDSGRFAGAAENSGELTRYPNAAWSENGVAAIRDEEGALALSLCLQEDWIAATDALGICSFSCRALLEDGLCTTSDLARILLHVPKEVPDEGPDEGPSGDPGERWLSIGAAVCELQARARPASCERSAPLTRSEEVYRALRGERRASEPRAVLAERLARVRRLDPSILGSEHAAPPSPQSRSHGAVRLRSFGALAEALGTSEFALTLDLPAPLDEVLREAARQRPAAEKLLFSAAGAPLPATHRDGTRLSGDSSVTKGEILDLVLALRGG